MGGILHPLLPKKEKKTPSFLEEVGDSKKSIDYALQIPTFVNANHKNLITALKEYLHFQELIFS